MDPWTAILPLISVVSLSMLREAIEDYYRYKSDRETNSQKFTVMKKAAFVELKSDQILVGDILLIRAGQ